MNRRGPLLRLVHSLDRRRAGRAFSVDVVLHRPGVAGASRVVLQQHLEGSGPRAFVVGSGERVDVAVPEAPPNPTARETSMGGDGLLARHLAIVVSPGPHATTVRLVSLHPERGIAVLPVDESVPDVDAIERLETSLGGVVGVGALRVSFEGFVLDVVVDGQRSGEVIEVLPVGAQLAFHNVGAVRPVGDVFASVAAPGGGGHAIPALVQFSTEPAPRGGVLVLRARQGVVRVEVPPGDLRRGVLIGRSRRCVVGRGFDENDGLSRVHALVLETDDSVHTLDLASRYGLREVARPAQQVMSSRIDDGVGCIVYGAGHLTCER